MTALLPVVVILVGPAATWLFVHGPGWKIEWAAMGPAIAVSVALAGLVERELARRREKTDTALTPQRLTSDLLERWRVGLLDAVTKLRVDDGGQLAKMVRQGDPVDAKAARVDHDAGRPRVRISGRLLAWSEIIRRWEASPERLVILGDPGYGKTVAALTLVKHINARDEPGANVAELFALAEWQRWRGEHPDAPFADWLAEQLTVAHPTVPAVVARELVDARLILPVLDGLDEIATVEHRRACIAAIDAYAGVGKPHRPFVLTCRAREYRELAPDWVRDDDCVVLVGLQPDQIRQRLHEQTSGRLAWDALRERQAAGDRSLNELFTSPLRLAIALQVYRDRDPGELLKLTIAQARGRLWELLLETSADGYPGATSTQVRGWLAWLAAGMRRSKRQRFRLHELYLLDPKSHGTFRVFRLFLALAVGMVAALVFGLVTGPLFDLLLRLVLGPDFSVDATTLDWLVFGLVLGLIIGLVVWRRASPRPSVRTRVDWPARLHHATQRRRLATDLIVGLAAGLIFGVSAHLVLGSGLFFGLFVGLVVGLGSFIVDLTAMVGTQVIVEEPPRRFANAGPDAVLLASRSSGLLSALLVGLAVGLAGVLVGGLLLVATYYAFPDETDVQIGLVAHLGLGLVFGLVFGLIFGLIFGLVGGLIFGLDAWSYHRWLCWRLAARGALPTALPAFLQWCAEDERGWLRISDAYEFRHRELLEHLAPAPPSD